jgi:hypothetical protein
LDHNYVIKYKVANLTIMYQAIFFIIYSRLNNFSAIRQLSPLLVTGLQRSRPTKGKNRPNKFGKIELKFWPIIFYMEDRANMMVYRVGKIFEIFAFVLEIPSPKYHEIQEFGQNFHISAIGPILILLGPTSLDLCLVFMAFSSEGYFSCQHLLRHGTSVYAVSSEGPAPTSERGIRTGDAKITRSLCLHSNHCAMRTTMLSSVIIIQKANTKSSVGQHRPSTNVKVWWGAMGE